MKRLVVFLCILVIAAGAVMAQVRPATPMKVSQTTHFMLDKNEQKDFAIQLGGGSYYIIWDILRLEGTHGANIAQAQLLKTDGVLLKKDLLSAQELGIVTRAGNQFQISKPLAARIRALNEDDPIEVWMTIIPSTQMRFIPFAFPDGALKPLTIGPEGKGGSLGHNKWAYHSIDLPAGKWNVSLYFRQKSGRNDSLIGDLDRFDKFGFRIPLWKIDLAAVAVETRQEKQLILTKPEMVIFRVTNEDFPVDYVIGIEKG